ncbi:MAG: hypothetical protein A3K22_03510 [Deltaproteobacteria bacterium RBG_16_42_7]|nr:MAG: hypothetical protein A3K22_03510 [Deltaproteobacteria bacterium RBG_16_42_7]
MKKAFEDRFLQKYKNKSPKELAEILGINQAANRRRGKGIRIKPNTIEAVIQEALNKYETGRRKYGELDLSKDNRDFLKEAEQELLDCINYCVFQILKLRKFKANNTQEVSNGN